MSTRIYHIYEYHRFVLREIPWLEGKIVVDVGCGKGIWAYLMCIERGGNNGYLVGLDLHHDFLKFCKKHKVYNDLIVADASKLPLRTGTTDVILCSETIEHLTRDDGELLLQEIERLCKRGSRVIITTPNVGHESWPFTSPIPLEVHRSSWRISDFSKRGYRVHGLGFKPMSMARVSNWNLWGLFFYVATPISFKLPMLGEFMIAVKDFNVKNPKT